MQHRFLRQIVPAVFAGVAALGGVGVAAADPEPNYQCPAMMFQNHGNCDAHNPDPFRDHCFGGRAGSLMDDGHCDGEPYPDGTFWRVTQHGAPSVERPGGWMSLAKECVVADGAGTRPAPPGGCGGAV